MARFKGEAKIAEMVRSAGGEAQQHPVRPGQPQAVAGQRLRLGLVAVGRVHGQA